MESSSKKSFEVMDQAAMNKLTAVQQQQLKQQVQDSSTKHADPCRFGGFYMSNGQLGAYSSL